MCACGQSASEFLRCKTRSDRQSAAEPLCRGKHIGLYADIFPSVELARSADARLHLVKYQYYIIFVAKLSYIFYVIVRSYQNSALALNYL